MQKNLRRDWCVESLFLQFLRSFEVKSKIHAQHHPCLLGCLCIQQLCGGEDTRVSWRGVLSIFPGMVAVKDRRPAQGEAMLLVAGPITSRIQAIQARYASCRKRKGNDRNDSFCQKQHNYIIYHIYGPSKKLGNLICSRTDQCSPFNFVILCYTLLLRVK